ncbi:hypothetical protein THAOC_02289 [Thalassiosira oceanica]|uniref:Uncharacterized protein n=1 Tax=Thalassiosira oceanica TaxID=159749 RepID=K0TQF8_THAOC|nr:hypothetical protein THAOC_02289 [Thalassiosira oceanica]|eukprot:EJK75972.1 hypothetical protein THAOC_02289 [Thalassiosira oceanica]
MVIQKLSNPLRITLWWRDKERFDEIMRTISHLVADIDPEDLLPEDSHLMEVDFNQLAKANSNVQRNWASAVVAARTVVQNLNFDGDSDSDDVAPRCLRRTACGTRWHLSSSSQVLAPTIPSTLYQTRIQIRDHGERRKKTYAVSQERGQSTLTDLIS